MKSKKGYKLSEDTKLQIYNFCNQLTMSFEVDELYKRYPRGSFTFSSILGETHLLLRFFYNERLLTENDFYRVCDMSFWAEQIVPIIKFFTSRVSSIPEYYSIKFNFFTEENEFWAHCSYETIQGIKNGKYLDSSSLINIAF